MRPAWSSPRKPGALASVSVGCMNFGARTPEPEARAIVDRALACGLRHFDTANIYANGKSERIVGRALAGITDAVIATKVGIAPRNGKPEGLAPEQVLKSASESLERLGCESVDLLYLHAPDHDTPLDETLDAIAQLVASGRIRHFGVSNYGAWEILEVFSLCDARSIARPQVSQVLMNLAVRQIEVEYARFAAKYGLHTTVFNPLAGGLLARSATWGVPPPGSRLATQARYRDRYWSERFVSFAGQCSALAAEAGLSLLDLAYGWLAQHPAVDSILAGPATVAHLDAAIAGCERQLSPELVGRIQTLQRAFDGTDASYAR